jgi:hypothetical protein
MSRDHIDQMERYLQQADEFAAKAEGLSASVQGSQRAPMFAAIAGMYSNMAATQAVLWQHDQRERRDREFRDRLVALERLNGLPERQAERPAPPQAVA